MRLLIALAGIIAVFGVALWFTAAAQATPLLPSQCPGAIGSYNVIDQSSPAAAIVTGTAGNDFIIVKTGIVYGEGGNDCILFTSTSANGIAFGGDGDDVIVTKKTGSNAGQAYGDYQISPYPVYGDTPINEPCDPDVDCEYPVTYLPEGTDRCVGKWAYKLGCEASN